MWFYSANEHHLFFITLTTTEILVVVGLVLDIIGFWLITRYGINLSLFAGRLDDIFLDLSPASPEQMEGEERENNRIKRQRAKARWGIRLVQLGFFCQMAGVLFF